jgi:integral membrane protein
MNVLSGGTAGAFARYRVMAFVTGVLLVLLVFVAIPLKYGAHQKDPVAIIGTAHGFLFMVYLVTALDLGIRRRWNLIKLGLIMIAGTVPFCSFYAEHKIRLEIQREPATTGASAGAGSGGPVAT